MPKKSLTATNLAVHQHRNCDLYIHNVYHQNACSSRQDGGSMQTPNLTKAQYKRGLDWESTLYSWLDKSELLLKVPSVPISADALLENIVADDRTHFFITGLSFWPPQDKLAKRYEEAGTTPLHFGLAKPDLVEIQRNNGNIQWRVIDAKASKTVKTSHHVQIYFYTLCLNLLLRSPAFKPLQTTGVWLPPSDGYHISSPSFSDIKTTPVSLLAPALDALIFRELPRVISAPVEKVKWHYNPLCQGCPYELSCKARAEAEGRLGTMANISVDDAQVLRDILRISRSTYARSKENVLADIEELHQLVANPAKFEQVQRESPALLTKGKRILGLPKKHGYQGIMPQSPLLEAARTKQLQIIQKRNYTCPSGEDIAIILTIISDPASSKPIGDFFCATVHSEIPYLTLPPSFTCPRSEFIPRLATLIRSIMALRSQTSFGYTCHFYVWTSSEQNILQGHIIDSAICASADDEDMRICIGAIAQGASLLQTAFQPTLLSGALMSFLGKGKQLKSDYQACLARLGLSREGTVDTLKKRLNAEIQKIQGEMSSSPGRDFGQRGFGQLPKVVPLMKEVQRHLALPLPGYWDLPECVKTLLPLERSCPTEEEVFSMFKLSEDSGDTQQLVSSLQERNRLIYSVLNEFRRVVTRSRQGLFVNEAKVLVPSFMDICLEPHIRKLFFMHQFEVLTKLTELWKSRIEGCPEAPTLEFSNVAQGPNGPEYLFRLISGTVDVPPSDKDRAFYDKLIVWDDGSEHNSDETRSENIPVEALFDDLAVAGSVFPLNRWAIVSWKKQHPRVQRELCVADIRNVYVDQQSQSTMIALRIWGTWDVKFTPGSIFRLSPRLVDFNTSKILSALFEIDLRWESEGLMHAGDDEEDDGHRGVPFLQLILSPESFGKVSNANKYVQIEKDIQKLFRALKDLGNTTAGSLVLKSSQHKATQGILANRLSVVWGPPGTGKTYTITLSLLRMLDAERRHAGPRRMIIFITAITHAAIEACCSKLRRLMDAYNSIESLPHKWLDDVTLEVVNKGSDHRGPSMSGNGIYIYAGTLFQLSNFMKQRSFLVDCVIVDEAGQISLGAMSLVLRSLTFEGRVIFAGDSEQLAPILSAQYPQLKFGSLFGSVLDCLMFSASHNRRQSMLMQQASQDSELEAPASQAIIVQLTENFRLNPDLGEFVSTIYSRRFKPQKVQARQLASALGSLLNDDDKHPGILPSVLQDIRKFLVALSDVMLTRHQTTLAPPELYSKVPQEASLEHRPVSLALIRLRSWSPSAQYITYESHVGAEAALAAGLVTLLRKCSPNDDIFVAAPHRIQREAVNAALSWIEMKDDTVDDITAGMAHIGLCSYSKRPKVRVDTVERLQGSEAAFVICLFSLPKGYSADLGFLLERRRLNVAISRAKTLCILISSSEVLCPSVKILAQEETAKGYAFLKAFETRAWSCDISVNAKDVSQDGSHM